MGAVVVWLLLLSCGIGQWSVTAKSSTKKHDSHSHHVVNITNGALRGKKVTTCNGVTYWSFEGIPYALPPVGPNRFKGPQEPQNWTDIREAVEEGSACPHFTDSLKGNEDCLFVNVYTPQNPKYWSTKHPLSVIVSFHSGSWMVGSGNWDIDIPEYMTYGKSVIIVTLNYRLGPLGFLNVDHPNVTANAGLKDQVAALKWVQNNIIYFGGDPNQVTISGKNAGGASVEYHMISPMSAGLFHKGISQSGSTLSYWAFKNDTTQRAFRYINYFGFEVTTIYELVEYFQNISWQELVIYQRYALTYQEQNQHLTPFIPTLEHEQQWGGEVFLPGPPEALIEFGYVHDVPLIFGLNPIKKVIYEDTPTTKNEWIWTVIQEDIERLVPADFNIHRGTDESSEITTKVKEFYFGSKNLSEKLLHRYISYKWDSFFLRGVINSINKHVRNIRVSPVYVFQQYLDITLRENTYCSQELAPYGGVAGEEMGSLFSALSHSRVDLVSSQSDLCSLGPLHGKELGSLFSTHSLSQLEVTSSKRTTLNNARLITAWNSFAKTGNPNNKYLPVTWFPATSLSVNALTVRHNFSIATEIHLEQMQFWDKVFSNYSTPSTNYTVIYTNYTVTDDQIDENTTFNTNYTKTLTNYTFTYTNYTIPVNYIGNYTVTSYNYTIPSNTTYAPTNNTIIYVNTTIVDSPNYSVHYYYTGSTSNTTIVYYNNTGSIITNYTVTYYSEGPSTNYTTNSTTTYYYTGPSTNYTTNYTITYSNGTVVYYNTTDVSSTIAYENVDSTIQTSDESADSGEESSSNSSDESSSNSSDESSSNSSDESSDESSSNSSVESSSISSDESSSNSSVESSSNSSDESSSNSSDESSSSSSVESSSESSVESSSNSSVESSSNSSDESSSISSVETSSISSDESSSNSSVESSSNSSVESSSNSSVESSSISSVESSSISSVESSSDSSVESSSISSVESSSNSSVESSSNSSVESSSNSSVESSSSSSNDTS